MDNPKQESTTPGKSTTQDQAQRPPPDPSRFVTFDEAEDGSGFYLPDGGDYFYAFDKFGGWFDEFGNYYNADGQPADAPEDVAIRIISQDSEEDELEAKDELEEEDLNEYEDNLIEEYELGAQVEDEEECEEIDEETEKLLTKNLEQEGNIS